MPTLLAFEDSLEVVVGSDFRHVSTRPLVPYNSPACDFLADLSKLLMASAEARSYPDVVAFAYWCRRANIQKMAQRFGSETRRLGLGLAFHIAPSNVPINFAYSLAFGILSGNANIVRLPSKERPEVDIVCTAVRSLFARESFTELAGRTSLIRYPRNDEITQYLSSICNARIIWGGDQTIAHMRRLPISPRCVELAFADRYSLCAIAARAVIDSSGDALKQLAKGFYNDIFPMDQNACASPHLVIWLGEPRAIEEAMEIFWSSVAEVTAQKYELHAIHAVDKYSLVCRNAILSPHLEDFRQHGSAIYRLRLRDLPSDLDAHRGKYGLFYEYCTSDLDCLSSIVTEKYQTLTYFGVDEQTLGDLVLNRGLRGIDRIVPIGRALDMGVTWDGHDLIGTLSRIIDVV